MNWKQIIWKELGIWKKAYPKEAKLLQKFATKIKLEIELQGGEKTISSPLANKQKREVKK